MIRFIKSKIFILVLSLSIISINSFSQDLLKGKDVSQIKVDMLTDEEILNYKAQLEQSGLSQSQAEQLAIQRGFPASEIVKLRARLAKLDGNAMTPELKKKVLDQAKKEKLEGGRSTDTTGFDKDLKKIKEKTFSTFIFGGDLFNNDNITFEPNLRIPTPSNYVIGADDELVVDVYGYQEVNHKLTVSPEGKIALPNVGLIDVSGTSVETATKRIKDRMTKSGYASINSGQSHLQVSVGKIRSIKITVIGDARKIGTYTLSSLASLFNALYACGGPSETGSLRNIELVRNSKVVKKFDAYKFLLNADQTSDVRLMDRDVIRIPSAKNLITLSGEINKPAVFEAIDGEPIAKIFEYAGGFAPNAYSASIHIIQTTDKEKKIKDVYKVDYNTYQPQNGDIIEIGKVLDRFANKITLKGAVYRPGFYEHSQGITLSKLIANADGLTPEAFTQRGIIKRVNDDYSKEMLSFNPIEIINGKQKDIDLKKNDEIEIGLSKDYKQEYVVSIQGEVKKPNEYPYYENQTLKDLIFAAGGYTDASSIDRIEIASRIDLEKYDSKSNDLSTVINITSQKDLDLKGADVKLKPWDIVTIRTKPGYKNQIKVNIQGEVLYPGSYIVANKNEKVSNLLTRAGGLSNSAFLKGCYITRINKNSILKDTTDIYFKKLKTQIKDSSSSVTNEYANRTFKIGLDIEKLLADSNSLENIYLQEDDVVNVPKQKREIKVNGEVLFPTEVVYVPNQNLKYYIDRAGGFTDAAAKKRVIVLNANGVAAKTKKFLFFKTYPKVDEGSEVFVPKVNISTSKKMTTAETIGIASAIASLAGVVIAILNITK
ncbi:MAG: SLBB domain-containing protein [Bacteroidetes bacterium]|nr:SLBB domain-containing protein [Bacteroidota bacterium]